ncbi:MAG: hypothetical protein K2Q10_05770 [Rhodospirillales bacterium]|nr:hypothetical protein [Rhodospirillales bacterium]
MSKLDEAWQQLEDAWQLAEQANTWLDNNSEGKAEDVVEPFFKPSPIVDWEKTAAEFAENKTIWLKSPFSLRINPENSRWIPFRTGLIDLSDEPIPQ